jgi:hypothetical protein
MTTYTIDTYTGQFCRQLSPRPTVAPGDVVEVVGEEPDAREWADLRSTLSACGCALTWTDHDDGVDTYVVEREVTP